MFEPLIASLLGLMPQQSAPGDPNAAKQQMIVQIGMIVVMGVVFWVLLIRPQQKRAKEQAELLKAIKPGDQVTTSSGIVGVIQSVKDHTVTIRSGDSKLEILKSAISETAKNTETKA